MSKKNKYFHEERSQEDFLDALFELEQGNISYEEFQANTNAAPYGVPSIEDTVMAKMKENEKKQNNKINHVIGKKDYSAFENAVVPHKAKKEEVKRNNQTENPEKRLNNIFKQNDNDDSNPIKDIDLEQLFDQSDLTIDQEEKPEVVKAADLAKVLSEKDREKSNVNPVHKTEVKPQETKSETHVNNNEKVSRMIASTYDTDLNKYTISDGISAVTISTEAPLHRTLNGVYNDEDAEDHIENIFYYVISMLHPTAIYTKEEFENDEYLKSLTYVDTTRFVFFEKGNYIFAYIINDDNYWTMESDLISKGYSAEDRLKVFVELAKAVGTVNTAFYSDDVDYVETIRETKNQKEEFIERLKKETDVVTKNDGDNSFDSLDIFDADKRQMYIRHLLSYITDGIITKEELDELEEEMSEEEADLYDDDDDDDDDEEYDEDETDDDTETVDTDESVEDVDPESMEINVDEDVSESTPEDSNRSIEVLSATKPSDSLDVL